jgi:hypothetical protein
VCKLQVRSRNAPAGCALLCAGFPRVVKGSPRMDASGLNQLCELCGRRLSKVKHHRAHGPGRACTPRCKPRQQMFELQAASAAAAAPVATRKRRATSDPGESPEPATSQTLTRRVIAPEPASTSKKQYNTRREEQIMRLLDETHARRMRAEEAAAAESQGGGEALRGGSLLSQAHSC